jgi:hypothetical protein
MPGTHDRIIADAAQIVLGPLGFRRKGRSRTWLADNGWWLAVVEFQPSAWSKGSYLNVAAHWLWSEIGSLSFDFGGRIAEHVEYVTDDEFTLAVARLAQCAAIESRRLADLFDSLTNAAEVLLEAGKQPHLHPGWSDYHAGVAAALIGRRDEARRMFKVILDSPAPPGSLLHPAADRMEQLLSDQTGFREQVLSLIKQQREALRLPLLTTDPF